MTVTRKHMGFHNSLWKMTPRTPHTLPCLSKGRESSSMIDFIKIAQKAIKVLWLLSNIKAYQMQVNISQYEVKN